MANNTQGGKALLSKSGAWNSTEYSKEILTLQGIQRNVIQGLKGILNYF